MKKKILLIDQADFIGGAELFNLDLINNLNTEEFKLNLLFSGNQNYQKKIKKKINEYAYPLPKIKSGFFKYWNLIKSVWLIRTIVKREKIDLIQTNTIRTHILAALAKKIFKLEVKLVWFVHDFTFPAKPLKKLIKIPNQILTCSETVKKDLLQKTNQSFAPKIAVVYNGVIPQKIKKEDKQMKALHNFIRTGTTRNVLQKFKIGIIGRLDPWKGQDVFLKAAKKVLEQNKKVEFSVIGSSSEYDRATIAFEQKLKELVKKLDLENSVTFSGYVEDLATEMKKLDIIVHASKKSEPFGRVIIEAMNFGKIVIASELGGPGEIIQNNQDGYLIAANNPEALAEKILEVLANENLREKVAYNAQKTVKTKFDLKEQIKKIEEVWRD